MRTLTDSDRITLCFIGGHLRRWHTSCIQGEERVDSHTWGMVSLILILHPNPTVDLIAAVQFHDAGEMFSGDIPHPAKQAVPGLGAGDKEVADRWATATGLDYLLDADDQWWVTFVDSAQAYLFARRQVAMGNTLMVNTVRRIREHCEDISRRAPKGAEFAWAAVRDAQVDACVTRTITQLEKGDIHAQQ